MGQANGHLDDMSDDLDDMVATVGEDGFLRLLANALELTFNLGQLEALAVPSSVEPAYTSGLAGLEATIGSLSDPIADQDDAALLAIIDTLRAEIADLHGIVITAT